MHNEIGHFSEAKTQVEIQSRYFLHNQTKEVCCTIMQALSTCEENGKHYNRARGTQEHTHLESFISCGLKHH